MANDHREGITPLAHIIHTSAHRAYSLSGNHTFTIGRDSDCNIVVNEVAVSRRHAELRPEGDGYTLNATGATPTLLNDIPLTGPHLLQEGDSFVIGTMRFVFTRDRLPVAMIVDPPTTEKLVSNVDNRRPTLTFQLPAQSESGGKLGRPLTVAILLLLAALVVYGLYQLR